MFDVLFFENLPFMT